MRNVSSNIHAQWARTQISPRIRAVWSKSLLSAWKILALSAIKKRLRKILIRLRKCGGWSGSSLGAHVRRYFFWCSGSIVSLLRLKPVKSSELCYVLFSDRYYGFTNHLCIIFKGWIYLVNTGETTFVTSSLPSTKICLFKYTENFTNKKKNENF